MTEVELYDILRKQIVSKPIEVYKESLQDTIERIFKENLKDSDFCFIRSKDHRITNRYITCSYFGESLRAVITDIENEHPVEIIFNPTPEGSYEISLEYKREITVYEE